MIEATKRPWKRDKYGYMTADGGNLYVAHGVTVPNGEHHPRYAEAFANEELILKAVNSHDALVAALKETMSALSDIINASETEPYTPEELQQNAFGKPVADAYAALEQVK